MCRLFVVTVLILFMGVVASSCTSSSSDDSANASSINGSLSPSDFSKDVKTDVELPRP